MFKAGKKIGELCHSEIQKERAERTRMLKARLAAKAKTDPKGIWAELLDSI
jgi:hypothetical protein